MASCLLHGLYRMLASYIRQLPGAHVDNAVQTWPGFFTSSWIFQRGLYLIIDNISKNLSVDNCLQLIDEQIERFYQKRQRFTDKQPKNSEV